MTRCWICWRAMPGSACCGWNWGCSRPMTGRLKALNRGHDVACFTRAVERAAGPGAGGGGPRDSGAARRRARGDGGHRGLSGPAALAGRQNPPALRGEGLRTWPGSIGREPTPASRKRHTCSLVVDFVELLPPHLVIHRLTGDPHRQELLAPDWCLDKSRVLGRIREEFARRGSRQGSRMK